MKRLILLLCLCSFAQADYLGSWKIDDFLTIMETLHDTSGDAVAATGAVDLWIYEDVTAAQIIDEEMAAFDGITGLYEERVELTAVAGFEAAKTYTVLIQATADGVSGIQTHTFQILASTDTQSMKADVITSTVMATDSVGADEIAANAIGASEIADNAIDAGAVADATIDAATYAAGAITASAIATDAIGAAEIAASAIGASELAANAITSSEIADGAITDAKVANDVQVDVLTIETVDATDQINTEVLDVLAVDTYAEAGATGAPPTAPTLAEILNYMYRKLFHERHVTSTLDVIRNFADDGDLFDAVLSDDGTTFIQEKYATP